MSGCRLSRQLFLRSLAPIIVAIFCNVPQREWPTVKVLLRGQVGQILASTAQLKLLLPRSSTMAISLSSRNDMAVIDGAGSDSKPCGRKPDRSGETETWGTENFVQEARLGW